MGIKKPRRGEVGYVCCVAGGKSGTISQPQSIVVTDRFRDIDLQKLFGNSPATDNT